MPLGRRGGVLRESCSAVVEVGRQLRVRDESLGHEVQVVSACMSNAQWSAGARQTSGEDVGRAGIYFRIAPFFTPEESASLSLCNSAVEPLIAIYAVPHSFT